MQRLYFSSRCSYCFCIYGVRQDLLFTGVHIFVFDLMGIKKMEARGFALGLTSHGIGTARAMSKDTKAGVVSAVAMGLNGLITSILVPL